MTPKQKLSCVSVGLDRFNLVNLSKSECTVAKIWDIKKFFKKPGLTAFKLSVQTVCEHK